MSLPYGRYSRTARASPRFTRRQPIIPQFTKRRFQAPQPYYRQGFKQYQPRYSQPRIPANYYGAYQLTQALKKAQKTLQKIAQTQTPAQQRETTRETCRTPFEANDASSSSDTISQPEELQDIRDEERQQC
jgi:hypothetical protein